MRELIEFRFPERLPERYLPPSRGQRLGIARALKLSPDDLLLRRIEQVDQQLRAKNAMRAIVVLGCCVVACATGHPSPVATTAPDPEWVRSDGWDGGAPPLRERMTPPVRISGPDPKYTRRAIRDRIEGTMLVICRITVEGTVVGCRVVKGLPYLDQAVVSALERRRYRPATLDGEPIEVNYRFTIHMRMP